MALSTLMVFVTLLNAFALTKVMISRNMEFCCRHHMACCYSKDASASMTSEEAATCLSAHNKLRQLHQGTYDLVWDAAIAAEAQKWANHLAELNQGTTETKLVHDSLSGYGENIFWSLDSKKATCARASLKWYNEFNRYSYTTAASTTTGKAIGHFTQVVWKDSKKVGVGIATLQRANGQIETFIVAKYSPPGNTYTTGQRYQTYTEMVRPRKAGAVTPTVEELDPSLIQECKNAKSDETCDYFIDQEEYSCTGKYVNYFKEHCYKKCNYC